MSVKRYDWQFGTIDEHNVGKYVMYDDYEILESENARLKEEIEKLRRIQKERESFRGEPLPTAIPFDPGAETGGEG